MNRTNKNIINFKLLLILLISLYFLYNYSVMAEECYSEERIAKKNFSNITLNILTHEEPIMGTPTKQHAKEFEELTGAKINVFYISFDSLYQEAMIGLKKGKYDIVIYGSLWTTDFKEYLEPLPQNMLESEEFKSVASYYKTISKWGDNYYQLPIDGDRHYFQYRSDILEDDSFKKEYENRFGEELLVPKTWKELNKVSKFLHNREFNGFKISGISEISNKDDLLFSQFIKRAASYVKHPDVGGGFYFDLETMEPLINTPGFVEALEDFVESQNYYKDKKHKNTLGDVIASFGGGEVVFSDSWDDPFVKAMEKSSKIREHVRAEISLGSKKVWNRESGEWNYFEEGNFVPYLSWGWTSAVSKKSKNKEAAFDFLGYFGNEKNHKKDLIVGEYGVNPFREEDLSVEFWQKYGGWSREVSESYINMLQKQEKIKSKIVDLNIYQSRQYMRDLSIGVYRALSGRDSAKEALDVVADRWRELNERIGVEKQREAYRRIVEFEDGGDINEVEK